MRSALPFRICFKNEKYVINIITYWLEVECWLVGWLQHKTSIYHIVLSCIAFLLNFKLLPARSYSHSHSHFHGLVCVSLSLFGQFNSTYQWYDKVCVRDTTAHCTIFFLFTFFASHSLRLLYWINDVRHLLSSTFAFIFTTKKKYIFQNFNNRFRFHCTLKLKLIFSYNFLLLLLRIPVK